jgi:hypothetical protein
MSTEVARWEHKKEWQRNQRRAFATEHGYSTAAHYATAGLRRRILDRDDSRCVRCGMSDAEHKAKWGRTITIDHIDKDRSRNTDDNLQTLCLTCHGNKDLIPALRTPKLLVHKNTIMALRSEGRTYQAIAARVGFSVAAVWKWERRWTMEAGA